MAQIPLTPTEGSNALVNANTLFTDKTPAQVSAGVDAGNDAQTKANVIIAKKPAATVATVAAAIAAVDAGTVEVGGLVDTEQYSGATGLGGNRYIARENASRPAEDGGSVIYCAGDKYLEGLFIDGRYTLYRYGLNSGDDATLALNSILGEGKSLDLDGLRGVRVTAPVSVLNKDVKISGDGGFIIDYSSSANGFKPFDFVIDMLTPESVTSIDSVDYDFGSGLTNVTRLTVTDESNFSVGDIVKVTSTDQIPWLDPVDSQKCGSSHTVGAIEPGFLYLLDKVYLPYSSSITVSRYNKDIKVSISGDITFEKSGSIVNFDRKSNIRIKGAYLPYVSGLSASGLFGEFIHFEGCYAPTTDNITGSDLVTDTSTQLFGYVVVERSCSYGNHTGITGINVRHPYTNGAIFNTQPSDYSGHGCNEYSDVYGVRAINCTSSGVDTHPESYQTTFFDPSVSYPNRGDDGALWSAQLRGVGDSIKGGIVRGGDGIVVRKEFSASELCSNIEISNLTYKGKLGEVVNAPVRVVGIASSRVLNFKLNGLVLSGCECNNFLEADYSEVFVMNCTGDLSLNSTGVSALYRMTDSYVESRNCIFDLRDSTSTNYRYSILSDSESELLSIDESLKVSGSAFAILADFNSLDGKARFFGLDTDVPPSFSNPGANRGSGAFFRWGYSVDRGQLGGSNIIQTSRTGNFSLNGLRIEEQTADDVYIEVDLSGASSLTQLTAIPLGTRIGQRLTVALKEGAAYDLQINGSSNLQRSSAIVLTEGESNTFTFSPSGKWAG